MFAFNFNFRRYTEGGKAYFAVELLHPPPASLATVSTLNFELTLERRPSVLDIAPLDAAVTVRTDG
jgi:hypothetical protein